MYLTCRVFTLFLVCLVAGSTLAQGSYTLARDGRTLTLYGAASVPIASIERIVTRAGPVDTDSFHVVVAPEHRFQWASDTAAGYRAGTHVTRSYYDVRAVPLQAPADHAGWRNLAPLDDYIIPVTEFAGQPRDDGRAFIAVRTNPTRSGFLIVITTVTQPEEGATPWKKDQRVTRSRLRVPVGVASEVER